MRKIIFFVANQHLFGFILVFLFSLLSVKVNAQSGEVDTTFSYELYNRFGNGKRAEGEVRSVLLQDDGKIIIAGNFYSYNDKAPAVMARLHQDGSTDTSFMLPGSPTGVLCTALQPDGKILAGGYFSPGSGTAFHIRRINSDGSVDASFAFGNLTTFGYARKIVIQPDGKILVAGAFSSYNGYSHNDLLRLMPDGSIDPSFTAPTFNLSSQSIFSIALQEDGKILIGGDFTQMNGSMVGRIVRLNSDGTHDASFNAGSGMNNTVMAIAIQEDGKIVAGGYFNQFQGAQQNGIIRLLADGSEDVSFNVGTGTMDVEALRIKPNGDIVVAGDFSSFNLVPSTSLVVLASDGSVQVTTIHAGSSTVKNMVIQPDDKIITCGDFHMSIGDFQVMGITRILPDGTMDSLFVPWTAASGSVYDIAPLPDGKVMVSGDFRSYDGIIRNRIARINENGELDETFDPGSGANATIYTIAVQQDGKILIGGDFTQYNGSTAGRIARLNPDGSLDMTFNSGQGIDLGTVFEIKLLPNGKLLIGGDFYTYNGTNVTGIARINPNGSLDPGFSTGNNANNVTDIELLSDGKILINGYINGSASNLNHTARLNPNGTLDPTYNRETPIGFLVRTISAQPDGKIVVGGNITSASINIMRLNPDGTADATFNPGTGINMEVKDVFVQTDNKIIVAGTFTNFNGEDVTNLVRLEEDGSMDQSFTTQDIGNQGAMYVVRQLPNGKLMAGGYFFNYLGKPAHAIVRLNNDVPGISDMQLSFGATPVGCNDSGMVIALPYYGVPPYSYEWQTVPVQTTQTIYPEVAGTYSVTVTDSTGYSIETSVLVPGFQHQNSFDLTSYLTSSEFRTGFDAQIRIQAVNSGCEATPAVLSIVLSPLLTFQNAIPVADAISGDTLTWNIASLSYMAPLEVFINVSVTDTATIGETVELITAITPAASDAYPEDNTKYYTFPVVNGYDPNYMSVYPEGKCDDHLIETDQLLTYTVHFQNTGNSHAVNIRVVDSLSTVLDMTTVRVIDQSHAVWTEVLPGNVIQFHFDNINLPDSTTNEAESHGYVTFDIMPNAGLANGVTITNQAGIYFDFNSPIITNEVSNEIYIGELDSYICNLGLADHEAYAIDVYPNPFEDGFTIKRENAGQANVVLTDLQGHEITPLISTDMSELYFRVPDITAGMYLLHIFTETGQTTVRIIKR